MKLRVLDLFSGIGGFSLGLERTGGFETVAFCEIEPFPRKVLAKHWPGVPIFEDVRKLRGRDVGAVDVITGGFPCQDISVCGRRAGLEGEHSGLWSEIARLVGELRPRYVILENSPSLLVRGMGDILRDLAHVGYDAEWEGIPAAAVGAAHLRARQWVVAYPRSERHSAPTSKVFTRRCGAELRRRWAGLPEVRRSAHGLPDRVDRVAAIGNSVVPDIPEIIGHAILRTEQAQNGKSENEGKMFDAVSTEQGENDPFHEIGQFAETTEIVEPASVLGAGHDGNGRRKVK